MLRIQRELCESPRNLIGFEVEAQVKNFDSEFGKKNKNEFFI